jgi:hypothetical protein
MIKQGEVRAKTFRDWIIRSEILGSQKSRERNGIEAQPIVAGFYSEKSTTSVAR